MKTQKILHISERHSVFVGDFGIARAHRHAVPALFIGLSGPIKVKVENQDAVQCHSALIDANVELMVDCQGEHVATLYFDVDSPSTASLRKTFLYAQKFAFDITDVTSHSKSFERKILGANLPALFNYTLAEVNSSIDPRIDICLKNMKTNPLNFRNQMNQADHVSLSVSRLNHLFKSNTGVSFRHYKLWSQIGYFMRDIHGTKNISMSALNSGFSDSSHLSNSYRKTLGTTPTSILANLDEFEICPAFLSK